MDLLIYIFRILHSASHSVRSLETYAYTWRTFVVPGEVTKNETVLPS